MMRMLHKEYPHPTLLKKCIHESDGYVYDDEDVARKLNYVTLRCRKCGEFYEEKKW